MSELSLTESVRRTLVNEHKYAVAQRNFARNTAVGLGCFSPSANAFEGGPTLYPLIVLS
jgi:hypothetical protein